MPAPVFTPVGTRYGRLVLQREIRVVRHPVLWECLCDCGAITTKRRIDVVSGNTLSCGCLRIESRQTATAKHHMTESKEYRSWCHMKERCSNPNEKMFHRYGGRGITVCDRWLRSFENFYADVGPAPSPLHSIDRIENDGNYEPGNVRWAVKSEQARNRSTTRIIECHGERRSVIEWSELSGIPFAVLMCRLKRGWEAERAISTPIMRIHRRSSPEQKTRPACQR